MSPHRDQEDRMPDLSPEDQIILDALIEVGFDRTKLDDLSEEDKKRLDSVEGLLHILEAYPVGQVDAADQRTLVDAALARIDQHEERTRSMVLSRILGEWVVLMFLSKLAVRVLYYNIEYPCTKKLERILFKL